MNMVIKIYMKTVLPSHRKRKIAVCLFLLLTKKATHSHGSCLVSHSVNGKKTESGCTYDKHVAQRLRVWALELTVDLKNLFITGLNAYIWSMRERENEREEERERGREGRARHEDHIVEASGDDLQELTTHLAVPRTCQTAHRRTAHPAPARPHPSSPRTPPSADCTPRLSWTAHPAGPHSPASCAPGPGRTVHPALAGPHSPAPARRLQRTAHPGLSWTAHPADPARPASRAPPPVGTAPRLPALDRYQSA